MIKLYRKDTAVQELTHQKSLKIFIEALDNHEFSLVYQPQVNAKEKTIHGFEALVRWERKDIGFVYPSEFIPFAEETGLIHELGYFVLEEAIQTASFWKSKGYPFKQISVNVSPLELENPEYIKTLISLCSKYNFPHNLLELEITEGLAFMGALDTINEFTKEGFKLAIDDFGVGHSNLFTLVTLDVSTIKIDKTMVDLIDNPRTQYILSSIVDFSKAYDLDVLIEGVETEEQKEILTKLGCYLIQGYYYSKPKTKEEISNILQKEYNI